MNATENSKPDDQRFYQLEMGRKRSRLEKKAGQFAWINGRLFIPAIVTGEPPQLTLLSAAFDNTPMYHYKRTIFVPADWVEKEYPHLQDALKIVKARAEQVRYEL